MNSYCVTEKQIPGHHAGSKARNDIAKILTSHGWKAVEVHSWKRNSIGDKLKMLLTAVPDWRRVCRQVPAGAQLLVQYPLASFPKTRRLALPFLRRLKKKRVWLVYLIHDLDSLRDGGSQMEKSFLDLADALIVHNPSMAAYLETMGYGKTRKIPLGLFDYLLPDRPVRPAPEEARLPVILVAGNLDPQKAGYVYQLEQLPKEMTFRLYGPHYAGGKTDSQVSYEGSYPPDVLPEKLQGDFGLVWDGDSLDTCSGIYGEYLRYNNPHKASLYLACGIPVILWSGAALAPLVEEKGCGLAVSSLRDIPERLAALGEDGYQKMRQRAELLSAGLRSGEWTLAALGKLEEMPDKEDV